MLLDELDELEELELDELELEELELDVLELEELELDELELLLDVTFSPPQALSSSAEPVSNMPQAIRWPKCHLHSFNIVGYSTCISFFLLITE